MCGKVEGKSGDRWRPGKKKASESQRAISAEETIMIKYHSELSSSPTVSTSNKESNVSALLEEIRQLRELLSEREMEIYVIRELLDSENN